jgi:hypothetical protein
MENNWTLLKKELAVYHILLQDNKMCSVLYNNEYVIVPIGKKINMLIRDILINKSVIEEIFKDLSNLLDNNKSEEVFVDQKSINLFLVSLKDFLHLFDADLNINGFKLNNLEIKDIYLKLKLLRNNNVYSKEVVNLLPDYKISIDWLLRTNKKISYIIKLLRFVQKGNKFIDNFKFANGISGPWANLDLPMLERKFEWADIEEEVQGRDRDIRRQGRYRGGQRVMDPSQTVGEGNYWREIRNDPYDWYDKSDNPYPIRDARWSGP